MSDSETPPAHPQPQGSLDPEKVLEATLAHLHELRLAALTGRRYDPDEFDDAVLAFRRAWEQAQRDRQGSQRNQSNQPDQSRAA